ncbi:hypothetical protein NHX12_010870 [Muraenolepis orangiensis]|uniref:Uncharacterized protein n=1 Tax=Muraenolepis orangiensis TaxID=630683 RepID=A0A9Q0DFC1_9TELE|nr:hypothetical protein NHX12_010870 [Muraenolepis orangiensis]
MAFAAFFEVTFFKDGVPEVGSRDAMGKGRGLKTGERRGGGKGGGAVHHPDEGPTGPTRWSTPWPLIAATWRRHQIGSGLWRFGVDLLWCLHCTCKRKLLLLKRSPTHGMWDVEVLLLTTPKAIRLGHSAAIAPPTPPLPPPRPRLTDCSRAAGQAVQGPVLVCGKLDRTQGNCRHGT